MIAAIEKVSKAALHKFVALQKVRS